jgi:hypothetical protein
MESEIPSEEIGDDVLEPVGAGELGYVYGTDHWVVKVSRFSVLRPFAKLLFRSRWAPEVRDSLGGLVVPFLLLDEVSFEAPKMTGRGRIVTVHRKRAIARARYEQETFLDHRLSLAEPAQALALVEEMVELVEAVRARGFYKHDFVMKNFVVVDGHLMIADTSLIVPVRSLWEPVRRIGAWGFWRWRSKDYQRLLGELRDELEETDPLRKRIASFRSALPARLGLLRDRSDRLSTEVPVSVDFDPVLEKEIRTGLGLR